MEEIEAAKSLLSDDPEWRKYYHWTVTTIAAEDLPKNCDFAVSADSTWVGGKCLGFSMGLHLDGEQCPDPEGGE